MLLKMSNTFKTVQKINNRDNNEILAKTFYYRKYGTMFLKEKLKTKKKNCQQ